MNIQTPIIITEIDILNGEIHSQSQKWDEDAHFLAFDQTLDMLELITDGLPDDPKISNALTVVHTRLSQIYSDSKAQFKKLNL